MDERLDKHAAAIRDLRAEMKELRALVDQLQQDRSRAAHPAGKGTMEPIALPSTCLVCRKDKGTGHDGKTRETLMTCQSCADERRDGIKAGGAARLAVLVDRCLSCQTRRKGLSSQLVCSRCRAGIKVWKEAQA